MAAKESRPKGNLKGRAWWSEEVTVAVKERAKAFKAYKLNPSPESTAVLSAARIYKGIEIIQEKHKSWRERITEVKADKDGWEILFAIERKWRRKPTLDKDCRKMERVLADNIVKSYFAKNRNRDRFKDDIWIKKKKRQLKKLESAKMKQHISRFGN